MAYEQPPHGKDPLLWDLARKRASFKSHLATYGVVITLLWVIWYFTGGPTYNRGIPWPLWATLGWGIGLGSHYFSAYVSDGQEAVEKEYQKLQNKKQQTV